MIEGEICVRINFSAEDESNIEITLRTLNSILNQFYKAGINLSNETDSLKDSIKIIEDIIQGKVF